MPDLANDWQACFADLGSAFYTPLSPTPVPEPEWAAVNEPLLPAVGLDANWMRSEAALAIFSGNRVPEAATPLASVYSGHQFGVWAGQLGDGRALLLGERAGQEIQLKGSGRTPYSRGGDGRAVLRSSIREDLASIALQALGIPTTQALCLVASPLPVQRERLESAAVLTRVAPSFIRFGHFEHFAAAGDVHALRQLADHVIAQHLPECLHADNLALCEGNPYAALLHTVSLRTAHLLALWQAQGFCHGVMNTDNMSILGLTLDYGPFQFLDRYLPAHVCNHSDTSGRYAFNQQPQIAYWNLHCLAQALLPLLDDEAQARRQIAAYPERFAAAFIHQMRNKLGLSEVDAGDLDLIQSLLEQLQAQQVDYPLFWWSLERASVTHDFAPVRALFADPDAFTAWLPRYRDRLDKQDQPDQPDQQARPLANPRYVLRSHVAEFVIQKAQKGDFQPLTAVARLLAQPFAERSADEASNEMSAMLGGIFTGLPPAWAHTISLSCSS